MVLLTSLRLKVAAVVILAAVFDSGMNLVHID